MSQTERIDTPRMLTSSTRIDMDWIQLFAENLFLIFSILSDTCAAAILVGAILNSKRVIPRHLIAAPFVVILFAKFVSVYPIVRFTELLGERIPTSWTKILAVAGLRGAVSVALALPLPEGRCKDAIVAMTFGVAHLSLIVQAEIPQAYLKRVDLHESHDALLETRAVIP